MIIINPSAQFANENMLTWEGATFTLSPSQNTHVAVLDGSAIHAKHDFLRNLAESLGFPEYFGHNWDALHDCLTDLAWIPAEHVLLIYHHAGRFRCAHPEDWGMACEILFEAVDYWAERQRVFAVMFA